MRLLLVEDNARLSGLVSHALVAEGFAVDAAETLRAAEELLELVTYDLIIVDLGLPDGDGLTLIKAVRAPFRFRRQSSSSLREVAWMIASLGSILVQTITL